MEAAETAADEGPRDAPWQTPGESPADAHDASESDVFAERPEVFVGAAFAGGLVVAGVLRWLGSR